MLINRTLNTKRNALFGIINRFTTLLLPFVVRTVMLRTLGVEYLGLSSLFASILQVLNLADLGFNTAIVHSLYKPIAEDDTKTICAYMNYFRTAYKIIGIIILAIGIVLTPFLPKLINADIPSFNNNYKYVNLYVLYIINLINTSLSYILFAYKQALPTAMQRVDVISNVSTLSSIILYCSQIVLLIKFRNYFAFIIAMPICTIINNILISVFVDRAYPWYKKEQRNHNILNAPQRKKIHSQIAGLMINKICFVSRNSFDSIFLSAFLGLSITAVYNNYYYILNAVVGILSIAISSMTSGVGNSIAVESIEKNYQDMRKLNFLYMWISGWCSVCLLCLYQPFMRLWMGSGFLFEYSVVILFVVYFYVLKMGDIRSMYVDGTGIWWLNRFRALAESSTNLILNYILGKLFGVHGIIVATLVSLFIINFGMGSQIVFKHYFRNNKLKEYFLDHFYYLGVTIIGSIMTVTTCHLISQHLDENWLILAVNFIICIILPNAIYWSIYHKTRIFSESITWVCNKFRLGS